MSSDPTNAGVGDGLRADWAWPALTDPLDIEEFPVLLTSGDVRALIDAAHQQGLTAAGLVRSLVCDYLRRIASVPSWTSCSLPSAASAPKVDAGSNNTPSCE